jgi:molybdenum cofactor biosynthesis enzyme MoaA/predicted dehydrogenase
MVHGGGRCDLRCALCDCRAPSSSAPDIARAVDGGGARLVIRGATEHSAAVPDIVAGARRQGFAEIILRTNAIACRTPAAAAAFARRGADAVLVPLFSQLPAVHDRIAGRSRALLDTLAGMRNLARAGLGVEIEVPILTPTLQQPVEVVRLVHRAVPSLRAVRFFVPPPAPAKALAPPLWTDAAPGLAAALLLCRELGVAARLGGEQGIPLCALRDHPDLHDLYAFNPKARSAKRADAVFAGVCDSCAVRAQCPGIAPSYFAAHGEAGLEAYAQRPALMYEQRTSRRRVWTAEQRVAASRAEILVLRPTVNCNQDCTFCSANETSANVWASREEMLRAIARTARRGIERVSFSGGEPTLSKHLVEYIHCASRLGVAKIEIVSNAVLLDKPEKVAALVAAGLTHAFVSLHAHDEELSRQSTQKVGDFARTVQGIKHLVDAGVETALNHVITARNYPYLIRYVEFVHREFGGKVNISFAFVTPQFKALDNIDVMPRLSLVMPHLKRALYRALELGQSFTIGSRQGIPFCFLDEFRAWSDGLKLSNAAMAEDSPQKQRAPACDECRFSDHCTGLWRPYVAQYGFSELRPVAGARLTPEDIEALHHFSRPLPWGSPTSFAELPAAIRAPDLECGPPEVAVAVAAPAAPFVAQRTRPLRVALLGSGRQARRIARHARDVAGLSIDAVASPHAPQADVRDFGDCPTYSDAAAALDDIRPEAVIIAAATAVHADLARLAIDRGVPALLEKPVTSSEEQGAALGAAAAAAGACIVPAHNALHAAGLDELFAEPCARPAVSYVWRRTRRSADCPRTWNRAALYETLYHVLAVVGRAAGGGDGEVMKASIRGEAMPEYLRLELRYGATPAEVVLDMDAALEEDVIARRDADRRESEQVWRRQGRATTIASAAGVRAVEAHGNDVQRMLANFRDVVLGRAAPATTLADALDVMRTARRAVDALEAAGAPFERPNAPKHVASRSLQPAVDQVGRRA